MINTEQFFKGTRSNAIQKLGLVALQTRELLTEKHQQQGDNDVTHCRAASHKYRSQNHRTLHNRWLGSSDERCKYEPYL